MTSLDFDTFVLDAATRFGLILYIVFALATFGLSFLAGFRHARSQRILLNFPTWLLFQLSNLCAFLAVAALGGEFPINLWLASTAFAITSYVIQGLLVHISGRSSPTVEIVPSEHKFVSVIVSAEAPLRMGLAGLTLLFIPLIYIGLLIRSGFIFDPAQMKDPDYRATIATYVLVLPAALPMIPILIVNLSMLTAWYATPMTRNLYLATTVGFLGGSSLLVFGPLYVYRDGFPRIASALPTVGTFTAVWVSAIGSVLIISYFIGYAGHRASTKELAGSRVKLISRAQALPSWREGSRYREKEAERLTNNILEAYTPLAKNKALFFFALKLLEDFGLEHGTDDARKRRLAILQMLGFGTDEGFEGDPIREMREIRARIMASFLLNPQAQSYFEAVESNLDEIAEIHPLLDNFRKLTMVLRAFVDSDTDLEYICDDLIAGEKTEKKAIAEARPALAFSAISIVFPLIYKTFNEEIRTLLVRQWSWVKAIGGLLFGAG